MPALGGMPDYEAHVQRIESELATLRLKVEGNSSPHAAMELQTRVFSREYQLLSLSGELTKLGLLYAAIEACSTLSPGPSDLWLLQACIALKLHRFEEARSLLHADPSRGACPQGRLIQADLDLQRGLYASAREAIACALDQDVAWDALARLAYLTGLLGDIDGADKLYLSAQEELTAKEMHAYAWVEVQRGVLDFQRGHYPEAMAHYHRAAKAYSGYWLIDERIAEAAGAQGDFDEAIAIYSRLYGRQARPEWAHAMSDLCSLSGDIGSAHTWRFKAFDGYMASVARNEVHYFHSLVDLCCEMPGRVQEALRWAEMDEALRSHYQTQGSMAWALYRCGRIGEAQRWIEKALESTVVCGRLYLLAACIFAAAGLDESSRRYFRLAKSFNALPVKASLTKGESKTDIRLVPAMRTGVNLLQHGL